jgi:anaerobic ribonucleoside-triphosphate reductase activating protein
MKNEKAVLILHHIDTLVDGRFVYELKDLTLKYRGSSNQRVIDVKKTLEVGEVVLIDC